MPNKSKKTEQELLGEQEVIRLIKTHPEVKACKNLTREQIRAVFRAYRDLVYMSAKMGNRICLPCLGQFYSIEKTGWKGGYMTYRTDMTDPSTETRDYFPPKPNYRIIKFDLNGKLKSNLRKETEVEQYTEEELIELRKQADLKEKELNG